MFPLLNYLELARLAQLLDRECAGSHVERLVIPERPDFPDGYLRSEWVLRLQNRRRDLALFLSMRPRACSVGLQEGKGPKHAQESTRSPFDQALAKHLKGTRIASVRSVERERMIVLEFPGFLLVLVLIPALPEALLVDSRTFEIVARSRTIRDPSKQSTHWAWPEAREVPSQLSVREELVSDAFAYQRAVEKAIREEAFRVRLERARRVIGELARQLAKSARQAQEARATANAEPDWALFGETLKAWLHALPEAEGGAWTLGEVRVPISVGKESLSPVQLIERFFQLARRRRRRLEEAESRLSSAQERLSRLDLEREVPDGDWRALLELERMAGVAGTAKGATEAAGSTAQALKVSVPSAWQGLVFVSKDGFPILVGKSRDENLELTFRIARGNDIWMHVRGRPGAHVVVPVPTGKSAPLETLLDAAALCIAFSGGKGWGKTEVDYTFKKHVKRIKDSTEASYTHNKTLIATPDEQRLERLKSMGQGG